MHLFQTLPTLLLATLVLTASSRCHAESCLTFDNATADKVERYVAERYGFAPDVTVEDKGLIGSSCYRMLSFQIATPAKSVVLYLSPDQHFLTPEIMDVNTHPEGDRQRADMRTETEFLSESSPMKGKRDAPVTIVEFSDFQCPYCKRFSELLNDLGPIKDKVRIVFKQYPLPDHTWARQAALASICAEGQSDNAFWSLHDGFFSQQESITPENLDNKIASLNQKIGLDSTRLKTCMAGHDAEDVLLKDQTLATRYRVDGTPIIFINGRRTKGFRNSEELRAAVAMALASSHVYRPAQASISQTF